MIYYSVGVMTVYLLNFNGEHVWIDPLDPPLFRYIASKQQCKKDSVEVQWSLLLKITLLHSCDWTTRISKSGDSFWLSVEL